jgi:hypothetical protein
MAHACDAVSLLDPIDATNTAGATGSWIAVSKYEGNLMFVQHVGTVTAGTIDGKIQDATSSGGAGAADVTGATFTQCGTSTDQAIEKIVVAANALRSHVRYVGTVATGPAEVSVCFIGHPKYVP